MRPGLDERMDSEEAISCLVADLSPLFIAIAAMSSLYFLVSPSLLRLFLSAHSQGIKSIKGGDGNGFLSLLTERVGQRLQRAIRPTQICFYTHISWGQTSQLFY